MVQEINVVGWLASLTYEKLCNLEQSYAHALEKSAHVDVHVNSVVNYVSQYAALKVPPEVKPCKP